MNWYPYSDAGMCGCYAIEKMEIIRPELRIFSDL